MKDKMICSRICLIGLISIITFFSAKAQGPKEELSGWEFTVKNLQKKLELERIAKLQDDLYAQAKSAMRSPFKFRLK